MMLVYYQLSIFINLLSRFRSFMSDPVMKPRYNISLAEERQLALDRLQRICDNGFISVLDFRDNPLRIFAAHELAAIIGLFSSFNFLFMTVVSPHQSKYITLHGS